MTFTVKYANGKTEKFNPQEFAEAFRHDDKTIFTENDGTIPIGYAEEWAGCADLSDVEDWDDVTLEEVVLPSGVSIEKGIDLNDRTFDENGNNIRPYAEDMYYITTDDGQEPVGGYRTYLEAVEEATK